MKIMVGLTICAALTDYMYVTTYRGNHSKTIELIDGELKEYPNVKLKEFKTGTEIGIIPSEKYLGPINLTTDIIEDYIRNMSYILDPDITVTFIGEKNPEEKIVFLFDKITIWPKEEIMKTAQSMKNRVLIFNPALFYGCVAIDCFFKEWKVRVEASLSRLNSSFDSVESILKECFQMYTPWRCLDLMNELTHYYSNILSSAYECLFHNKQIFTMNRAKTQSKTMWNSFISI